jgi:hypothetical protein
LGVGDETTRSYEGKAPEFGDGNPKNRFGLAKVPMRLAPASARIQLALAFKDGARKYGPYNWRISGVKASIYWDAAMRHMDAWLDGEECAPDSGVHHLGHAMACLAIIIDAAETGQLNDDRPPKGPASEMQQRYLENIPEMKPDLSAQRQEAVAAEKLPVVASGAEFMEREYDENFLSFYRGKWWWAYAYEHPSNAAFFTAWRDGQIRDGSDLVYWVNTRVVELYSCHQDLKHVSTPPHKIGRFRIPTLSEEKGHPVRD